MQKSKRAKCELFGCKREARWLAQLGTLMKPGPHLHICSAHVDRLTTTPRPRVMEVVEKGKSIFVLKDW